MESTDLKIKHTSCHGAISSNVSAPELDGLRGAWEELFITELTRIFKSLRTTYSTLKEQSSKASTHVGGNQLNRTTQNRNLILETLYGNGK